jgi:hypothetical protein
MADDVIMPSNSLVVLIKDEKFGETSFDVNVSQRPHEKKPSKRVVHTRIDHLPWDGQLFPNPHALVIYLKFVPTREVMPKRFKKC